MAGIPPRSGKAVKDVSEIPEISEDPELDLLDEEAQKAMTALGWAGVYKEDIRVSSDTIVCSERDVIALMNERVGYLVNLVSSQQTSPNSSAGNEPHIRGIIQFLDDCLEEMGKQYLTPREANRLLAEKGLLRDSPSEPGEPLRRILRARKIPYAFKSSGKWLIPHSSSKES